MAMKDLPLWLLGNEGFVKRLKTLTIDSVISQFDSVVSTYQDSVEEVNVSYMLTCASLLAHSDKSQCQEAALRIAQYCLQSNEPKNRKDGAALVLDALANNATIRLAEKRDMIDGGYESRIPLSAQLESTKRRHYALIAHPPREWWPQPLSPKNACYLGCSVIQPYEKGMPCVPTFPIVLQSQNIIAHTSCGIKRQRGI